MEETFLLASGLGSMEMGILYNWPCGLQPCQAIGLQWRCHPTEMSPKEVTAFIFFSLMLPKPLHFKAKQQLKKKKQYNFDTLTLVCEVTGSWTSVHGKDLSGRSSCSSTF